MYLPIRPCQKFLSVSAVLSVYTVAYAHVASETVLGDVIHEIEVCGVQSTSHQFS